jgi:serine/threonine-protein kinase
MSLSAGTRIGPYEVQAPLGAGGMGEVYRARDAKLARDVALKILPAEFALDPDRLARFTREAQVLASLNHQNIAGIYGFEEGPAVAFAADAAMAPKEAGHCTHALVLEFVDGPTLADRIAQGPLSIDDALPIARQIADALEAAHEQGIIHRDLKPANIKVRPDGTVKVLDFGLAKLAQATGPRPQASVSALTLSPTITTPAITQVGMIMGTAAYMSPEQAKGREADKRSDIWAFGCVLFEMLTGTRTFAGDDVSDTLAAVLRADPDWNALPASTPRAIRTLLRRCLEKDRRRRLADAADARLEIEEALTSPHDEPDRGAKQPKRLWQSRPSVIAATAFVLGGLMVGLTMWLQSPRESPVVSRLTLPLGDKAFLETGNPVLAISRDGRRVVFAADRRLYLRSLTEFDARPIPGTDVPAGQVAAPVFSPDDQAIAFVSGRPATMKRISANGGTAVTICEGCGALGTMSWDGQSIVFIQAGQGVPTGFAGERASQGSHRVMRVAADGGEPQLLLTITDGLPFNLNVLPGGKAVLFGLIPAKTSAVLEGSVSDAQIVVQSLDAAHRRTVIATGSAPRYVPTGHIVYARQGVLFAKRFDPDRLEATGEEVPVIEGVRRAVFVGGTSTTSAYFDVSEAGSLVYVPGPVTIAPQYDLAVLDPKTGVQPLKLTPNAYEFPRVSPDGRWIAVGVNDQRSANIWIYDRSGANAVRRLTDMGKNRFPVWSPDGLWVAFQSDREGDPVLFRQRADGSGNAERLTKPDPGTSHVPDTWSPDGRTLLFDRVTDSERTLWALSLNDKTSARVGDIGGLAPLDATFSPNGRWLAYRSVGSEGLSVSVAPFPATGSKFLVGPGMHPVWSRDGKTLYTRRMTTGEFLATPVTSEGAFSFGVAQQLPITFVERQSASTARNHDITPDGKFIGVIAVGESQVNPSHQINLVVNWFEELKQKLPR